MKSQALAWVSKHRSLTYLMGLLHMKTFGFRRVGGMGTLGPTPLLKKPLTALNWAKSEIQLLVVSRMVSAKWWNLAWWLRQSLGSYCLTSQQQE